LVSDTSAHIQRYSDFRYFKSERLISQADPKFYHYKEKMKIICLVLAIFLVSVATGQYSLPSSLKVTETLATCDNVQNLITTANNDMKTLVKDLGNSRTLLGNVKSLVS